MATRDMTGTRLFLAALGAIVTLALAPAAFADDWVAAKLRGTVFTLVDGTWSQLKRGDVVPDDRVVRTLASGRVTFERDAETIEVMGNSQVQIVDQASGRRYTTVHQHYGTVAIEAEVQNVKHFEVRTATMAAVVKGTRFVVTSDAGGTDVEVDRGHVFVECLFSHMTSTVAKDQTAANGHGALLHVGGQGTLPTVYDAKGKPVL